MAHAEGIVAGVLSEELSEVGVGSGCAGVEKEVEARSGEERAEDCENEGDAIVDAADAADRPPDTDAGGDRALELRAGALRGVGPCKTMLLDRGALLVSRASPPSSIGPVAAAGTTAWSERP